MKYLLAALIAIACVIGVAATQTGADRKLEITALSADPSRVTAGNLLVRIDAPRGTGSVKVLAGGILAAYEGITVDDFDAQSETFLRSAQHPTLGRSYLDCAYAPMIELLAYLKANGFANYIVSGGGRDFMRPISDELYGVPRERVIGSATKFAYTSDDQGGRITHAAAPDYIDDGPEKPIRIWDRTGRRPLFAAGNSNGDVPMLDFAHHADKSSFRLLVLHDDYGREFDYTTGAEQALERAEKMGWTVVSVKNDWRTVFLNGRPC